jgi:hypothetical protein
MPELTLKLTIDPVTGKKTLVADYHSDADALPNEHEEEHAKLVRKLVEGVPLDAAALVVDRETEKTPAEGAQEPEGEREPVAQKDG